ncbi:hypothetical protein P170DRAFT_422501 [Aspergillus steynii IBT 23096]|uniref:Uncharacterized protein n=1 Tax=Aspergillus steynii IBT 23096 TaxID=1392250 RepID=A0A2I2GF41_9EURO|nr:uncharacterized protein P170DRAFT_422501 [Aspergillus steynii IBT 23096]PLB51492.1 hypothetical protein P170DRAFT_422501 [Aspergillus steynii IBT 23096]
MANTATTPYDILNTFLGEYGRVTAAAPEDRVGAMWSVILTSTFPVASFAIEPQSKNPSGYTDFTVSEWTSRRGGRLVRRPFLVSTTKKAPSRGAPGWKGAEIQLKKYLRGHVQAAARGEIGSSKLFGAVAIGTEVKFYTYNKLEGHISPLHRQRQGFEVMNDAEVVIKRLEHTKRSH